MLGLRYGEFKELITMSELMFSHNRDCDNKLWFGEIALNGFERFIFNDEIMIPPLFDSYDDFVNHDWPEFVEDNSFM